MLSASPEVSAFVSVSECKEGQRLLRAASKANPQSGTREAFLKHNKHRPVCSAPSEQLSLPDYAGDTQFLSLNDENHRPHQDCPGLA
jgi:hypothetical protein